MARPKKDNRNTGPATGNPGGARVVTLVDPDQGNDPEAFDRVMDAALAPAVRTYNPGHNMHDNDFSAPTQKEQKPEETPSTEPVGEEPPEDPGLPAWKKDHRFQGEPEKIYNSYQELEKKLSQQGQEVSQYRNFFDTYLKNQMQQQQTPAPQPANGEPSPEDVELLNKMLGSPRTFIQDLRQQFFSELQGMAHQNEVARIKHEHQSVISDPAFVQWLTTTVPYSVAQEADQNPQMLNYLLNGYKSMQGQVQHTQQVKQQTEQELAQKAQKVQAAAGISATSRGGGEKVWTRREIMRMMQENPSEYARLSRPGGAIYEASMKGLIKD